MADTKEIIVNIDDLDLEPHTKEWLTRVFDHAYKKGQQSVLKRWPNEENFFGEFRGVWLKTPTTSTAQAVEWAYFRLTELLNGEGEI
jgi:hypothetical protein